MKAFTEILREFRKIHPEFTVAGVQVFMHVATKEGCGVIDISRAIGISKSGASRHVLNMSLWNRYHKPGFDLMETKEWPMDRRHKGIYLTDKGKELYNKIKEHSVMAFSQVDKAELVSEKHRANAAKLLAVLDEGAIQ